MAIHIRARHMGEELTPGGKWLLGRAAAVAVALAIPLALGMAGASRGGTQSAEASNGRSPSFETTSIKPDKGYEPLAAGRLLPGMPLAGVRLSGGNFVATTIVTAMIMDAYGEGYSRPLNPTQVLGGPAWIRTDFYEINAKVNDSMVNGEWKNLPYDKRWDQAVLMLRSLLINRFKLRIERETKVLPVYPE
ncbi:MAG: TIGR03435 family protein [Candidatus Acidiferrales bacterium]